MAAFSPFSPVDIRILPRDQGTAALESLLQGVDGVAVLASASMIKRLELGPLIERLLASHGGILLREIPANPTVSDVCHTLRALDGRKINALVAIGGGSCIDLAKAVSALHNLLSGEELSEEAVREAIRQRAYTAPHSFINIIALPTTAGTGSEVTKWATVWDPKHHQKLSIDCLENYPKAAICIPEWTALMSPELTLSTGLDALSHAMEAFWANSRTPLSQALAISAIEKIRLYLPRVMLPEGAGDLEARREMCLGALLAGLAFSITRTTACHSISYPLTMLFGIPHGFAAAMTLCAVLARNEDKVPRIREIRALFAGEGGLPAWLFRLTEPVKPLRLSSFGMRAQDLNAIVELTFTTGRMDNNPTLFSKQEVFNILKECL